MARSVWIDKYVRKTIADEAVRHPKEPREDLCNRLSKQIEADGYPVPSHETILRLISTARTTPPKFQELWTMASLKDRENDLPPESIPSVLKVWRYAINTGEKFTVAHAQWVARLYPFYPQASLLWFWSYQYAHEERLSLATKQEMDTFILDSNLTLTEWERDTLLKTDFRDKPLKFKTERFLPIDDDGNVIMELLHGNIPTNPWDDNYFNKRNLELSHLIEDLPPLKKLRLTEEATMVYIRWFTYLTKGPKWEALSADDALSVIVDLRKIIKKEQSYRRKSRQALASQPRDFFVYMSAHEDSPSFYSSISPLLQRVGYHQAPKEVNDHERSHHKERQE